MVTLLCQVPGTRHSGCGIYPPGRPPGGSRITPRTCCPWPSPQTTDRSYQLPGTRQSSCGTLWPSASTLSRRTVTRTGCPVSGSLLTTPTPSSCLLGGTSM